MAETQVVKDASRTRRSVQTFGRKKTATAVAFITDGVGLIKVNGQPLHLIEPEILQFKLFEPILLLGKDSFSKINIRIRVSGGGRVAQVYAIRQSIAKGLLAWTQKYVDESTKTQIREILLAYDRTLLVADPRRCEPKKFGGTGPRARFQKSYR